MLRPTGFLSTELGDIEILVHEGQLHAFHLCLPNHDRIAHWVSADGIVWEACPDALTTGPPGAFDDDQLWTMSVTPCAEGFVMLYTALSRRERGRVQRMGRATSADLMTWARDPEAVAVAAGEHYETEAERGAPWVAFRDPKPVALGQAWAVVVCALAPEGPPNRRGVVALLRSDDLETFELMPPIHAPRSAFELECPQLVATEEGYVLLTSLQDDRSVRWVHAQALSGPYRTPANDRLLPEPFYAARVFEHRGGLAVVGTYRYRDRRGRLHHVMPTPMRLELSSGSAVLRPWLAALDRFESEGTRMRFETPRFGNAAVDGPLSVASGEELWTADVRLADGVIRGRLAGDGPRYGLAFDVTEQGAGWFFELEPALREARLVRRAAIVDADGMPWFEHEVVQRNVWSGRDDELSVMLLGDEVQLALGGAVILHAVIDREGDGALGVWANSGRLRADLAVHEGRAPVHVVRSS